VQKPVVKIPKKQSPAIPKATKNKQNFPPCSVTIEEVPDEETPIPHLIPDEEDQDGAPEETTSPIYDTKDDIWNEETSMAPKVSSIAEYPLSDDEVLLEYSSDFSQVIISENLTFDTLLTRDGTSQKELRHATTLTPLRNQWILPTPPYEEVEKISNKAQEFAKAGVQAQKKKTFKELVPDYL
jgi:hypothetical protein